ncbi:hypothetical protein [Microbacterium enclense]|uniref:hypothetical protein n=1 Tax=Microbacterium enclense TaxID=993073 RepID=UPI00341864A1
MTGFEQKTLTRKVRGVVGKTVHAKPLVQERHNRMLPEPSVPSNLDTSVEQILALRSQHHSLHTGHPEIEESPE